MQDNKVKLAVFDFDGTLIPEQSGHQLSKKLLRDKQLSKTTIVKLIFWGLRYKAHLPYNEKRARELIFTAFENENAEQVNALIDNFYEEKLEDTVRLPLIEIANDLKKQGAEIVILSGAFTSTLGSFAKRHDFMHIVGTQMEIDENGNYTGKVSGECVAGDEKIKQLFEYADNNWGKDNWTIEYAFADHYTDRDLLDLATTVYAVEPDVTLKRYAKKKNWEIIEFD